MDLELSGKGFLVTGGTNGLGLALAHTLVSEGARVVVCGRDEARLRSTASLLGPSGLVVAADVTNAADRDRLLDATREFLPTIDGLVNNAGKSAATRVSDSTDEQWRDDYELKVMAGLSLTRSLLNDLRASRGSVVNVLAIMGRTMPAGSTPTAASRAAGLALTKVLSHELGADGVRVNAVLVGLIESGQWQARAEQSGTEVDALYSALASAMPIALGRVGRAQEFADVVTFLLSARASYLTGVALNVDGCLSTVA